MKFMAMTSAADFIGAAIRSERTHSSVYHPQPRKQRAGSSKFQNTSIPKLSFIIPVFALIPALAFFIPAPQTASH